MLPHDPPNPSPPTAGLATLAILVLGVAIWMYTERSGLSELAPAANPVPSTAVPRDLRGFRPDAWFLPDDDLLGFTEIPAGPFVMGADGTTDPMAFDNERWSVSAAQGTISLPAFYLGRYEVTTAQYAGFVSATGFGVDPRTLQAPPDHPVSFVSWPDALAYCRWLENTLQDSPHTPLELQRLLNDGWGVTLPTEAQWEKAARGLDGRTYPWGDSPSRDQANYQGQGTTAVGRYPCAECPFGFFDMSGNVWEWTRSPYQPYPFDESNDREGLDEDALWVIRGGSFTDQARLTRGSTRGGADPGARRAFIGLRIALSRF